MESGLLQEYSTDGTKFPLKCAAQNKKSTCDNSGKCCLAALLPSEENFQNQKGWLQEDTEAAAYHVIFHSKLHCELNYIE